MLQEFSRCYLLKTGSTFDVKRRHIRSVQQASTRWHRFYYADTPSRRCLAHIINLATQAVITTRSKAKFHDGSPDDGELPEDLGASERDEVGLVRTICVKVCLISFIPIGSTSDLRIRRHAHRLNVKKPLRLFNTAATFHRCNCSST